MAYFCEIFKFQLAISLIKIATENMYPVRQLRILRLVPTVHITQGTVMLMENDKPKLRETY